MFKSDPKKPVSKRAWAVQILTRDYLVEGLLQPRIDDAAQYFTDLLRLLKQGPTSGLDLPLFTARVQPASNLAAQPWSFSEWTIRLGRNVVAFVPADSILGWSEMRAFQPLVDAQIDCLAPGARLTGWQVPWLLLNGELVQGDGRQPS